MTRDDGARGDARKRAEGSRSGVEKDSACPRCRHSIADHWPNPGEPTTACRWCLTQQYATCDRSDEHRVGICCMPADQIEYAARTRDLPPGDPA